MNTQSYTDRQGKFIMGAVGALIGPVLVFGLVLMMNLMDDGLKNDRMLEPTNMNIVKQEKPKPKKKVEKKKPKPKPKRARAPVPSANLNSNLSGIDVGLPGLDMGGFSGDKSLLGNTEPTVMTQDAVDSMPQPKVKGNFIYPKTAKKRAIEGYVVMSVLINVDGSVEKVQVLEASPQGVFEESALAGMRAWRFEPARYQGKAVKVWAKQKIRFTLG
ncbi:MAG: energy transducer TonB [Methylococcales bacterium]|nr:energy transducer TonB [Methylococcales bacterium]